MIRGKLGKEIYFSGF